MGMRFRNLTKNDKKLEPKDIDFLITIDTFFSNALDGLKAFRYFHIGVDLHDWDLCLELIPKTYGCNNITDIEKKIIEFKDLIKITLDLGEIKKEMFDDMRKFFIELQEKSIRDFPKHRCM